MPRGSLPFAVVLLLLTLGYFRVSQAYPFYYAWDMDWTTTLDALLLQSGELPHHVNHTGFGMYLVLAWTHRLASALGHVSLRDMSDLAGPGNPLVGIAELADFFRAHTPLVLAAVALAQVVALSWIARLATAGDAARASVVRAAPFLLLVLLLVGVQDSAVYHAAFIRTEVYSLLFWSLALAAGVAALRARSRRTGALRFGLCGLLLALSWTTKLQSLLLVGWLLLLLLLLRELRGARSPVVRVEPAAGPGRFVPGLCLFAAVGLLVGGAAAFDVPRGLSTFVESYRMNSAAVLLLAAYLTPLLLAFSGRRLPALDALLAGALVVGPLHLLIYAAPRTGWTYLLVDAKLLLFRTNYQSLALVDPVRLALRLVDEVARAPGLFVVHGCLLVLALRARRARRLRALLLLVEVGLLCHIGLATRDHLRDILWTRLPLVLWTIVLSISLLASARASRGRVAGVLSLLVLALLAQALGVVRLTSRLDAHLLTYNWSVGRWFEGVYDGRHRDYTALVEERVDRTDVARWARAASTQARDWAQARRDLEHALANHEGSLRDITCAEVGFRLPHDTARLEAVPDDLRGGLLFRPPAWAPTTRLFHERSFQATTRTSPEAQATPRTPPPTEPPRLALLGRPDLDVVLFLPAGAQAPAGWAAGPEQVEVATASGPARYDAFRPDLYGEVEVTRLAGGAFVLIKRRF